MEVLSASHALDTQFRPNRDEKGAVQPRSVNEMHVGSPGTPAFFKEWLAKQPRAEADKATEIVRIYCGGVLQYEELPPTMKGAVPMSLDDRAALAKALHAGNRYPRLLCEDASPAAPAAPVVDIDALVAAKVAEALAKLAPAARPTIDATPLVPAKPVVSAAATGEPETITAEG